MVKYEDIKKANESIQTTAIKGKNYAEVNQRIKAFRMVYPDGFIKSYLISNENGICIFRCEVGYYDGAGSCYVLGVGTAYEKEGSSFINEKSYIENCETSAVGRALGMAGFGIDTSVASFEEVKTAIDNQQNDNSKVITKEQAEAYKLTFGKFKGKTILEVKEIDSSYIDYLRNKGDEDVKRVIDMLIVNDKGNGEAIYCPKCGIQILNTPVKSGKVLSPDEVMEKWGMCDRCYKEEIKTKKTLEDLKRERP